jgi:hypothetical protein
MNFRVDCPCGRQVTVSEASAGVRVNCLCGREVRVPALHELRKSVGLPPYPISPELEIEHVLGRGEYPQRGPCTRCGGETEVLARVIIQFGERVEEDHAEEVNTFLSVLLFGLLGVLVWRRRGVRVFDKEYWLLLHLCPACRPRVRKVRAIKECLRKVDMYERLLEKHPYAQVQLG